MLVKLENGIPVGNPIDEKNFRKLYNNTSFPRSLTTDCVEPFGYGLYQYTKPPIPGRHFKVEETVPVRNSDGIFMQTWETGAMSAPNGPTQRFQSHRRFVAEVSVGHARA